MLLGICQIMLSILNLTLPGGPLVINIAQLPILIVVFCAGLYATFKIPSLVQDIFSGSASAGGGGGGLQSAITGMVMKAF